VCCGTRRCARERRRRPRVRLPRLPVDPARAGARSRRPGPGPRAPRRTIVWLLRARPGESSRAAGSSRMHQRNGGRRVSPRDRRGLAVPGPAHRTHGRPAAEAPRDGCEPNDRSGRPVRAIRAELRRTAGPDLGPRHARVARGRPACGTRDGGSPDRTGPRELSVRRAPRARWVRGVGTRGDRSGARRGRMAGSRDLPGRGQRGGRDRRGARHPGRWVARARRRRVPVCGCQAPRSRPDRPS
jgi:hypothetical protein